MNCDDDMLGSPMSSSIDAEGDMQKLTESENKPIKFSSSRRMKKKEPGANAQFLERVFKALFETDACKVFFSQGIYVLSNEKLSFVCRRSICSSETKVALASDANKGIEVPEKLLKLDPLFWGVCCRKKTSTAKLRDNTSLLCYQFGDKWTPCAILHYSENGKLSIDTDPKAIEGALEGMKDGVPSSLKKQVKDLMESHNPDFHEERNAEEQTYNPEKKRRLYQLINPVPGESEPSVLYRNCDGVCVPYACYLSDGQETHSGAGFITTQNGDELEIAHPLKTTKESELRSCDANPVPLEMKFYDCDQPENTNSHQTMGEQYHYDDSQEDPETNDWLSEGILLFP